MTLSIATVAFLTLVIHLVATLAYAVRVVGIRTGKIAVSFSMFNLLVLGARFANALQAPLLAKYVEQRLLMENAAAAAENDFRLILLAAAAGTLCGAILVPTFVNLLSKVVDRFSVQRSVPRLLLQLFTRVGLMHIRQTARVPRKGSLRQLQSIRKYPISLILLNGAAVMLLTVGALASLYAGFYAPELRLTAMSLTALITGFATIVLAVFIDPYLSALSDEVLVSRDGEPFFRQCVILMIGSRLAGTLAAQLLLLPAAALIALIAAAI